MTLWFVFALMTAAASFAVLWPLRHRDHVPSGGSEAAVYRDQLADTTGNAQSPVENGIFRYKAGNAPKVSADVEIDTLRGMFAVSVQRFQIIGSRLDGVRQPYS